ncbi:uncharacterized protein LOC105384084 [Plutella xylostella]|uniref:uncharacterized protein LOC105384084 n=1 Tax=Plutella xylostella TaxID=51655 RepID=UPI002032D6C7|nr:uncharacterized protein LOC105384084 [Plutella xylostella]
MCYLCTFHCLPILKTNTFFGSRLRLLCLLIGYLQIIIPILLAILVFVAKWQKMFIYLVWHFSSIFMNVILIIGVHLDFAFVCQWYYIFYMVRAVMSLGAFVYSWVDLNVRGILIFGVYLVFDCLVVIVVRSHFFHLRDKKLSARAAEQAVREAQQASRRNKKKSRKKHGASSVGSDKDPEIANVGVSQPPAPTAPTAPAAPTAPSAPSDLTATRPSAQNAPQPKPNVGKPTK